MHFKTYSYSSAVKSSDVASSSLAADADAVWVFSLASVRSAVFPPADAVVVVVVVVVVAGAVAGAGAVADPVAADVDVGVSVDVAGVFFVDVAGDTTSLSSAANTGGVRATAPPFAVNVLFSIGDVDPGVETIVFFTELNFLGASGSKDERFFVFLWIRVSVHGRLKSDELCNIVFFPTAVLTEVTPHCQFSNFETNCFDAWLSIPPQRRHTTTTRRTSSQC